MNAANDFPGSVSARLGENGAAAGLDGGRVAAPTDLGIDPPDGLQDRAAFFQGASFHLIHWPALPALPSGRTRDGRAFLLGVAVAGARLAEISDHDL